MERLWLENMQIGINNKEDTMEEKINDTEDVPIETL